jgi:hypothetical protein
MTPCVALASDSSKAAASQAVDSPAEAAMHFNSLLAAADSRVDSRVVAKAADFRAEDSRVVAAVAVVDSPAAEALVVAVEIAEAEVVEATAEAEVVAEAAGHSPSFSIIVQTTFYITP